MIINLSASDERASAAAGPGHVPRVIVIVQSRAWRGALVRFDPSQAQLSADGHHLRIGDTNLTYDGDRYRIDLNLPGSGIKGRLWFRPSADPFVVNNQPLGSAGRLSWLAVAHLDASGWLETPDERLSFRRDAAYHDHNWGRFRWGDGFGWEWGSALPSAGGGSWSAVFMRMTDGDRHRVLSQGLYLWNGRRLRASFRDGDLTAHHHGFLRAAPETTLPAVMALLTPEQASDIPAELVVEAENRSGRVTLRFAPRQYARVAIPSETDEHGVVILNEIMGAASINGHVDNETIETRASGVFELLR